MPFIKITVTVPKEIISVEGVRRAIIDAQNHSTSPNIRALFRRTVEGWNKAPYFTARRIDTSNQLGIFVHPAGPYADKYAMLNEGARAHIIRPRRARMLHFQVGYRAGTRPRSLNSRAYSRFGDFVRTGMVRHPGFEAREFTQTIADTYEPDFIDEMNEAIARGAR
jgi:hypothetical protein